MEKEENMVNKRNSNIKNKLKEANEENSNKKVDKKLPGGEKEKQSKSDQSDKISRSKKIVEEIESLKKSNTDLLDRLQRTMAEFDNFRKRTVKEKSAMYDEGIIQTVEKILPIIDSFDIAIKNFEDKEDNFYKGFEMILKQLYLILEEVGVTKIDSVGEKFDTNYHFAVAHVNDDSYSENEVIEELQKGYKYRDRTIRCSMVKVAN